MASIFIIFTEDAVKVMLAAMACVIVLPNLIKGIDHFCDNE